MSKIIVLGTRALSKAELWMTHSGRSSRRPAHCGSNRMVKVAMRL